MKYSYVIGGLYRCEPDWIWYVPAMNDFDIWMVLGGNGWIDAESEAFTISRGDCFVFHPGASLKAWHNPKNPLRVIAVHFVPNGPEDPVPFNLHRKIPDPDLLYKLLEKSIRHSREGFAEKANYWLNAALTELEEFDQSTNRPLPGCHDARLSEICARIKQSPERDWTVAGLATDCRLSSDHFCKLFKTFTGIPPVEYVINARVEEAQNCLRASSMNVSQIAARLGYSSVYFFSRQFKKKTGLAPREYRDAFTRRQHQPSG